MDFWRTEGSARKRQTRVRDSLARGKPKGMDDTEGSDRQMTRPGPLRSGLTDDPARGPFSSTTNRRTKPPPNISSMASNPRVGCGATLGLGVDLISAWHCARRCPPENGRDHRACCGVFRRHSDQPPQWLVILGSARERLVGGLHGNFSPGPSSWIQGVWREGARRAALFAGEANRRLPLFPL